MERQFTYRDYARYAALPADKLAAQCHMDVFRAKGPGGQCVNTTDSAVRMRHEPTGIVAASRERRSQLQNRERCLEKIHAELVRRSTPPKVRRATKPTKASQRRRLEGKRKRGDVKRLRRRPGEDG